MMYPHSIQVRLGRELRIRLDRLRDERAVNISAWVRLVIARALDAELRKDPPGDPRPNLGRSPEC